MTELINDNLRFTFPNVHDEAKCAINFQRTLRIPDDNREYPLPPGLGSFPMEHVDDHTPRLPGVWSNHGGVLLPMYQSEALWINFSGHYPCAVKIATGKINAVTGEGWTDQLTKDPQDYVVIPDQPWLDGYCVKKGLIRQFVAMPIGGGYTAEEQLTGIAEHGGLQIIVYPMKRLHYEAMMKRQSNRYHKDVCFSINEMSAPSEMGLAPGGLMRQEIYEDEYGFDAWDLEASSRCFVHILNSDQWNKVTGNPLTGAPPSAIDYSEAGLPWFEYYDDRQSALKGGDKLSGLDSIAAKGVKLGENPLESNEPVDAHNVISIKPNTKKVIEGEW